MKEYTIERVCAGSDEEYAVVNPSGRQICRGCSWRTARKIADALNTVRWQG